MANSATKPQIYEVLLSQLLVTALASSDVMAWLMELSAGSSRIMLFSGGWLGMLRWIMKFGDDGMAQLHLFCLMPWPAFRYAHSRQFRVLTAHWWMPKPSRWLVIDICWHILCFDNFDRCAHCGKYGFFSLANSHFCMSNGLVHSFINANRSVGTFESIQSILNCISFSTAFNSYQFCLSFDSSSHHNPFS